MKTSMPRDTSMWATARRSIAAMTSAEPSADRSQFPHVYDAKGKTHSLLLRRSAHGERPLCLSAGRSVCSGTERRFQRCLPGGNGTGLSVTFREHSIPTARQMSPRASSPIPSNQLYLAIWLYTGATGSVCFNQNAVALLGNRHLPVAKRYQRMQLHGHVPVSTERSRYRLTGARNSSASTM